MRSLDLQLTGDTLATIAHFDAALAKPGGALLLIGLCGVGRRAAVELVAYMHLLTVMSPACTVGFGPRQFRAFLKDVVRSAGVEGAPTLLLVEDHHVADACVLEAVNSLLSSGEVPGLFSLEEADKELKPLEETKASLGAGSQSTFDFFVARVRKARPASH